MKRQCDIAVISDVHLGVPQCRAASLLSYLNSIDPKQIILNGDIFDIQKRKGKYWPREHQRVVRKLLAFAVDDVPVYYVTGNHDAALRRFSGVEMGLINLVDRMEITCQDKKYLVVHGDVFDSHTQGLLHKFGGFAYDVILGFHSRVNTLRMHFGRTPYSFNALLDTCVPKVEHIISRYEERAMTYAAHAGYDGVICGHIHKPCMKQAVFGGRAVDYLNSGDWVDHCTALEYANGQWHLHKQEYTKPRRMSTAGVVSVRLPAAKPVLAA